MTTGTELSQEQAIALLEESHALYTAERAQAVRAAFGLSKPLSPQFIRAKGDYTRCNVIEPVAVEGRDLPGPAVWSLDLAYDIALTVLPRFWAEVAALGAHNAWGFQSRYIVSRLREELKDGFPLRVPVGGGSRGDKPLFEGGSHDDD